MLLNLVKNLSVKQIGRILTYKTLVLVNRYVSIASNYY